MLSTLALAWGEDFLGSVSGPFVYTRVIDSEISKRIMVYDVPHMFVVNASRRMRKRSLEIVGDPLKRAVDKHVSGVRIIILSEISWMDEESSRDVDHFTEHVRSFYTADHIRCLEFLFTGIDDWDRAMLRTILLKAVSGSVVAFRFENRESPGEIIKESRHITTHFEGLTADRVRILFMDCATTSSFRDVRTTVQDKAVMSGLPEPLLNEDILFEHGTTTDIFREFRERATKHRSIINKEISGPSRKIVEDIVRVLNNENSEEEARNESMECIEFVLGLRSKDTSISIRKEIGKVKISCSDATGYAGGGGNWNDQILW